jgi:hypothetical protein
LTATFGKQYVLWGRDLVQSVSIKYRTINTMLERIGYMYSHSDGRFMRRFSVEKKQGRYMTPREEDVSRNNCHKFQYEN